MNNTLSVVMATYNEKRDFLQNCIQSILSQTYRDFEFLIVIEPGELNRDYLNHVAASDSRVRIIENGTSKSIDICTRCLRSNKVTRAVRTKKVV